MRDLERLARAMRKPLFSTPVLWTEEEAAAEIAKPIRLIELDQVRAILTELREPSEGMIRAGLKGINPDCCCGCNAACVIELAIDHILQRPA